MRTFTVAAAAAALALMAMPAHAQMGGKRHQGDEKKTEQKKPEVDDKAYKAALERIPEPKEKYDPWGIARPAEPDKKPKEPALLASFAGSSRSPQHREGARHHRHRLVVGGAGQRDAAEAHGASEANHPR